MLKIKPNDAKALKILTKYDVFAAGLVARGFPLADWQREIVEKNSTSLEDLSYLKQHGLAFEPIAISHDGALEKCFEYSALCKKKSVTDAFLVSLSSARLDYRSGLSAYALMQTMPKHLFQPPTEHFCAVCGGQESTVRLDLTHLNKERFVYGSMIGFRTPFELQFFLKQHLSLEEASPTSTDFSIFNAIIDTILHAGDGAKPNEVAKKLRTISGFKASVDQCKALLEIFGFCSMLETEKHRGYLSTFTRPGFAPSKSHSSNWAYPVDFWTGKDGINRKAFAFWFGDYPEIALAS